METLIKIAYVGFFVGTGIWLGIGVVTYGMLFAFLQRNYTDKEATTDLYTDMKTALAFIPQGFFGLIKASSYLMENEGWDEDGIAPTYGFKFLPRHEHRS
jgi:hypothetical protein